MYCIPNNKYEKIRMKDAMHCIIFLYTIKHEKTKLTTNY
ncbi:MAG: hypothetical protein ACI8RD_000243 [Bacillariaceae sp.]|jgi:hypothetical protein